VVIAAPIEFTGIEFENLSLPSLPPRTFVKWFVTHVVADAINPSFFGNTRDPVPDFVFTTEEAVGSVPFVSVKVVAQASDGLPIYKIFSNQGLFPL